MELAIRFCYSVNQGDPTANFKPESYTEETWLGLSFRAISLPLTPILDFARRLANPLTALFVAPLT